LVIHENKGEAMDRKTGIRLILLLGFVALIAASCSTLAAPDTDAAAPDEMSEGADDDMDMSDEAMDDSDMDDSMSGDDMADDDMADDDMSDDDMADDDMSDEEMTDDHDMSDDDMADDDMDDMSSDMSGEEDMSEGEATHPDRPTGPVPVNGDYRYDPATVVGATGSPQFLEFFTSWCPTCKAMKPTIHALEAEYWGKLDFVYLDREAPANSEVVATYGIASQPIFILVDANGNEVERWFGTVPEDTLRAAFDDYLAASSS
jgi:thiol-disulfide isomerase/thioredoxin